MIQGRVDRKEGALPQGDGEGEVENSWQGPGVLSGGGGGEGGQEGVGWGGGDRRGQWGGDWEGATGRGDERGAKGRGRRRNNRKGHFTDGYDGMPGWT